MREFFDGVEIPDDMDESVIQEFQKAFDAQNLLKLAKDGRVKLDFGKIEIATEHLLPAQFTLKEKMMVKFK